MDKSSFIIFGGTGDLTARKLIPAIYNLAYDKIVDENFFVVLIGRRDKKEDEIFDELKKSIKKFSNHSYKEEIIKFVSERLYYFRMSFDDASKYAQLEMFLKDLENKYSTNGNRIYNLAVSPNYFETIVKLLDENGMAKSEKSWRRVMIEKPFGKDLKSARHLSKVITGIFGEDSTYRIDHYLGKQMLRNIMAIRFSNAFFEPMWNNKYIDHVQIISSETVGVGSRGGYYENSGALKDMVQNHLLQLLSVTAMEPPVDLETESIRDEKVKVLKSLRKIDAQSVKSNIVRAQYIGANVDGSYVKGYKEEEKVSEKSMTETYFAGEIYIDNYRWYGVPFYITTGKSLAKKTTEVVIQFKPISKVLYLADGNDIPANQLIIKIQPDEGIYFRFNAKKLDSSDGIEPVKMNYCQSCMVGYNSPEAYETLISSAIKGEKSLFTRWDEVEYSWQFIDSIITAWKEEETPVYTYKVGSFIPAEACNLISKKGRKWNNDEMPKY